MTVIMEDGKLVEERWDACSEPERPVDRLTFFRSGCKACLIKLHAWGRQQAIARRGRPQKVHDLRLDSEDRGELITVDRALELEGIVLPRAGRLP